MYLVSLIVTDRFQDFCSMNNFWLPEKRDNLRKSLSLLSISAEKKRLNGVLQKHP